ncbi:MAG: hypothetical protein ACRCRP_00640 [Metamycoplasmataceae bacterium]
MENKTELRINKWKEYREEMIRGENIFDSILNSDEKFKALYLKSKKILSLKSVEEIENNKLFKFDFFLNEKDNFKSKINSLSKEIEKVELLENNENNLEFSLNEFDNLYNAFFKNNKEENTTDFKISNINYKEEKWK